ncbi:hypothetical protein EGI99_08430 [Stutzerimonas stutzeri]|nr:hypothetical protein EGI99_08430 [Stutzerimonas stutzeri]
MTFNTGNNVPSTDPRDLYDNAENLDKLVNGADPFYADRKGKLRESWAGMENSFTNAQEGRETAFTLSQADKESRFQAFLVSSGYVSKGDYAAGVVLAERNEYVAVDAATTGTTAGLYRPGPGATLPLTLTGTWATDAASLVLLGDDVLRQELGGSIDTEQGARLVQGAAMYVATLTDLLSIQTAGLTAGRVVVVATTGRAGVFAWTPGDLSAQVAADTAKGVYVSSGAGADGAWVRQYERGAVHAEWFGAEPAPGIDNRAAILAAHNFCATSSQDRRLLFSAGKYEIHSTLTIRGLVHWQGSSDGGAGTIIEWMGQDSVAISCDAGDWSGNYQGTFESLGVYRGAGASSAYAFDLIRCSEFLFDRVYANDMKSVFRFRGAAIMYFRKIVSAYCDSVFEYAESTGMWANSMHVISDGNYWETGTVFKFTSGESYSIFVKDCWAERFTQFIGHGHDDDLPMSLLGMHVSDSHLLSVDTPGARLINFIAKPGTAKVDTARVVFSNVRCALNSTDHICYTSLGFNVAPSTFLFSETAFRDCHIYGAPMALFGADAPGATVRVSGNSLIQQGYFTGSLLPYTASLARVAETSKAQYYAVAWTSSGAVQPSIGNGTIGASYTIVGGVTKGVITLNFGSTTSPGDPEWKFSIPAGSTNQFAQITGTATIQVPGVEIFVAAVLGVVQNGSLQLVLAKNGFMAPLGVATNATTQVVIEFSYDNEPT